jgi:hypothetical protein
MPLEFNKFINIPPIPIDASRAAAQAVMILKRANSVGSMARAKNEAADAIFKTMPDDIASEQKRLRLLYQKVYTKSELINLVDITFAKLGLIDQDD